MSLMNIGEPARANPLEVVERMASVNDRSFERAGEDEITLLVRGKWTDYQVSFTWMFDIEALHLAGRSDEARALYEQMLTRLTPAGLLSEDSDFETGELWGNYPQTYSLVGLINCAGLLSRPWTSIR